MRNGFTKKFEFSKITNRKRGAREPKRDMLNRLHHQLLTIGVMDLDLNANGELQLTFAVDFRIFHPVPSFETPQKPVNLSGRAVTHSWVYNQSKSRSIWSILRFRTI